MLQLPTPSVWSVTRDFWAKPQILVTSAKQTLVYSVFYRNAEGGENACALFRWKSISSTYPVCSSVSHTLWDCHSVGVSFTLVARLLMWVRGQHGKIKKFFRLFCCGISFVPSFTLRPFSPALWGVLLYWVHKDRVHLIINSIFKDKFISKYVGICGIPSFPLANILHNRVHFFYTVTNMSIWISVGILIETKTDPITFWEVKRSLTVWTYIVVVWNSFNFIRWKSFRWTNFKWTISGWNFGWENCGGNCLLAWK